jgi:hypothetical protein
MTYPSNETLFAAARRVAATLDDGGCPEAAAQLRQGLAAVNGLTDGWALFLESLDGACAACPDRLGQSVRSELSALRVAVRAVVYR